MERYCLVSNDTKYFNHEFGYQFTKNPYGPVWIMQVKRVTEHPRASDVNLTDWLAGDRISEEFKAKHRKIKRYFNR